MHQSPDADQAEQADQAGRFANYLRQLAERDDRAALAALRRGVGKPPGAVAEMNRYVVPWLPTSPWADDAYYQVAALFALHGESWRGERDRWRSNLGASFARLGDDAGAERRFVALLNAHRDDLMAHVRRAVTLLRARDVAVDWGQLLRDILAWDHPERWVQRRWARAYWGHPKASTAEGAAITGDAEIDRAERE